MSNCVACAKNLADEKGVPPFVVFGDLSLRQMALYLPQSEENFSGISGVGEEKLKQYGKIFTEVIQTYARENNLSEKEYPVKRSARPRRINPFGVDLSGNPRNWCCKKCQLSKWRVLRGLSAATILAHIEKLVSSGEEIDLDYLRPPLEKFEQIAAAFQQSGGQAFGAGAGNARRTIFLRRIKNSQAIYQSVDHQEKLSSPCPGAAADLFFKQALDGPGGAVLVHKGRQNYGQGDTTMGYTIVGLKEKILEMYPEIPKLGVVSTLTFDDAKQAYVLKLQKGPHELSTYIDKPDADRCMDGHVCVSLGVQVRQFLENFKER